MSRLVRIGVLGLLVGAMSALTAGEAPAQNRRRDLLTREEIEKSAQKGQDLLQVVRSLRPHFLSAPRGVRSMMNGPPAPVVLYVDDVRRSGIDELKLIKPELVEEVRYLEPSRAQDQYGITHSGGAVLVTLRKNPA